MDAAATVIVGCGDVGRRIARQLVSAGHPADCIFAWVRSAAGMLQCRQQGLVTRRIDLDDDIHIAKELAGGQLYYLVPPQKEGIEDLRSRRFIKAMLEQSVLPGKVVLVSTTGVYGDCAGEWVTERSPAIPATERGQRRLHAEQQWLALSTACGIELNILRVPGIYANSRIPLARLRAATPVVTPSQCGYSNRIHAEDLAMVAIAAMQQPVAGEIFNVTDGTPGKITDYLQQAAAVAGLPELPEISMQAARQTLSAGMLSYLGESRKISNRKMLDKLKVALRYPDFRIGLRH